MRRALVLLGLVALLPWLGGCGFHLRGAGSLPPIMAKVYIDGPLKQRVLIRELEYQLLRQGAQVVDSAGQATLVLRLEKYEEQARTVAMDSNGFAREKELTVVLHFSAYNRELQPLLSSRSLQRENSVLVDKGNAIASDRAQRDRYEELQRRLASALIDLLRYQLREAPAPDETGQQ